MNITINGAPADIALENEKTLGEVLAGLEQWLEGTGNRLSGLAVDGDIIGPEELPAVFNREAAGLRSLELRVILWDELALEAFYTLRDYARLMEELPFEKRDELRAEWERSPSAGFLGEELPDFGSLAERSFRGEGIAPSGLALLCEERIRELTDPRGELRNSGSLVGDIVKRLEDLPLDMQTGKDQRAAETIQLFSRTGEKLFRILSMLRRRGDSKGIFMDDFTIEDQNVHEFLGEFNAALGELNAAYENHDTVLAGDLAEYELAPRLSRFFAALTAQE